MHRIYRVLLFITYFGVLIHCQGGGGGGGGGGSGGGGGGGGYYGNNYDSGDGGSSCTTAECGRNAGIAVGSVFGGIIIIGSSVFGIFCCCRSCRGRPRHDNSTFINKSNSTQFQSGEYNSNVFESGLWSSQYFQYKRWHGSHRLSLAFDPQWMRVTGSGSDDVGRFLVDGSYSVQTHRIGLRKIYQIGTGDRFENLAHQVILQLTWNAENGQFEGKWYVQTKKFRGEGKFELKFDGQPVSTVYGKV